MQKRLFITATGTDIGKTFVTAALVRQAKALGKKVAAYKPVISGFDPAKLAESDGGILLRALGLAPAPENIERVMPWRYAAPLAPSLAAPMEGRTINFDTLTRWSYQAVDGPEDVVLIEGVGGVMAPLDDQRTVLDWMEALRIPALLVTGSYLGTLSHTLTALAVLEQRKVPVAGVIVNESENSSVALDTTAGELKRRTQAPVIAVARRSGKDAWEDVGELEAVLK